MKERINISNILRIFSYLSNYLENKNKNLEKADGAFVFGRADPLVAEKASEIYHYGLINYIMFTGGIGKDSGILAHLQIPEAKFQAGLANILYKVPKEDMYLETQASNGAECCGFGIGTIYSNNLPHENLILVAHPTSLRRMQAMMEFIGPEINFKANYQTARTNYEFNPRNPVDQKEAVDELLRLADWPGKGWLHSQRDLPEDLLEYARYAKKILDN